MEKPGRDTVVSQPARELPSVGSNTGMSSEPEQEQHGESEPGNQPESNQETPETRRSPSPLALIQLRMQQLHNRRFLLLKMQHFRKKTEQDVGRTKKDMVGEDGDELCGELCELQVIQRELEELLVKKEELEELEELEKQGQNSKLTANRGHSEHHPFHKSEMPCGGIYMLPPPQLTQVDVPPEQSAAAADRTTDAVIPVDGLRRTAGLTRCPSCEEIIVTEVCSKVGETMWIACCLCSMMGCVAGCCLIPFAAECLRDVHHRCPACRADVHTFTAL